MSEFTCQNRGGKGVKCYKIMEKTGNVVGVKAVNEGNEIMLITTEGIIIRLQCSDISVLGRITSGVKLMDVAENITVASIAKVREKKEKNAAYRSLIRPELADELYDKILNIVVVQKKYKDPDYSAKDLAKELKTNTRYLSAVVNSRFGMNYSCLLNEYRVKDAKHLLTDKRYADKNVEEISTMVGFANRQSFYAAFYKNVGETPNGYRKKHADKKQ